MNVVLCSAPPAVARNLARVVVNEELAACVTIVPGVQSVYRWQGEVCEEVEALLVLKTPITAAGALAQRLREIHPYDTPEIVVLPVDTDATDPDYLSWVRQVVSP